MPDSKADGDSHINLLLYHVYWEKEWTRKSCLTMNVVLTPGNLGPYFETQQFKKELGTCALVIRGRLPTRLPRENPALRPDDQGDCPIWAALRRPCLAHTPHVGTPTSPWGLRPELESSARLLCFFFFLSLSYLGMWWRLEGTYEAQTPAILGTCISPPASGCLALTEILLQCASDRMLRTGSSSWHGAPLTGKQEASSIIFTHTTEDQSSWEQFKISPCRRPRWCLLWPMRGSQQVGGKEKLWNNWCRRAFCRIQHHFPLPRLQRPPRERGAVWFQSPPTPLKSTWRKGRHPSCQCRSTWADLLLQCCLSQLEVSHLHRQVTQPTPPAFPKRYHF